MQVTQHWSFRSQPRMTRKKFADYAKANFSGKVLEERDPGEYWDAIVSRGIDPCYILAKFKHESQCGKDGAAVHTKSWGNTRWPNFGAPAINTDSDPFAAYATWLDGCISTVARLNDHVYHERFTIRQVYIWEPDPEVVWAPPTDGNDPAAYIGAVVSEMNRIKETDGDVAMIDAFKAVPEVRVMFLDAGQKNVEGVTYPRSKFVGVTNHETDDDGASALDEHGYLLEGAQTAKGTPSWHFTVDENMVVMNLPLTWRGYHAGDNLGPGSWTYAVEICVGRGADQWERTLRNVAWLNAQLLRIVALQTNQSITGWNISDVLSQHNRWSGKDCPHDLRATGRWSENIVRTTRALTMSAAEQPAQKPEYRFFPETGHWMGHGFLRYWEDNGGIPIFGYPTTEEFYHDVLKLVVQYTERSRFEFHPELPDGQRVLLGRIGVEVQEAYQTIIKLQGELQECKDASITTKKATASPMGLLASPSETTPTTGSSPKKPKRSPAPSNGSDSGSATAATPKPRKTPASSTATKPPKPSKPSRTSATSAPVTPALPKRSSGRAKPSER